MYKYIIFCFSLIIISSNIYSDNINKETDQYKKFVEITKELRCIECQNQSIFDSDIQIAVDMKKSIIHMLNNGVEKKEIFIILKEKYGERIDFKPNIESNKFLWIEPFIMLLISFFFILKTTKLK